MPQHSLAALLSAAICEILIIPGFAQQQEENRPQPEAGLSTTELAAGKSNSDTSVGDRNWPQWRGGPTRSGCVASGPALASSWPEGGPKRLWKASLPRSTSPGNVVVADGKVFVSIATAGKDASGRATLLATVLCLKAETGKTLWEKQLGRTARGWVAPGVTPAVWGGKVYVAWGPADKAAKGRRLRRTDSMSVVCLRAADGEILWRAKQSITSTNLTMHGSPFSSPLVVDGVCVVQATGASAFEATTGKHLWSQPLVDRAHASPTAWKSGSDTIILCRSNTPARQDGLTVVDRRRSGKQRAIGGGTLYGLDAKTGKARWILAAHGGMWNASTPAVAGRTLVDLDRSGISAFTLDANAPTGLWTADSDHHKVPGHYGSSPTVAGKFVYYPIASAGTSLVCLRLSDGQVTSKLALGKGRRGAGLFSSPVLVDGKVLQTVGGVKGGTLFLIAGGPKLRLLDSFEIKGLLAHTSVTVSNGHAFVRLTDGVACYDLTPRATRG